jgi:hypothetical protein
MLREAHRLKVLENRVLRRIFGSLRQEVAGGWKRLHINDLCNLYTLSNIRVIKSVSMRWGMLFAWKR